jgi:PAS domain-containing protein
MSPACSADERPQVTFYRRERSMGDIGPASGISILNDALLAALPDGVVAYAADGRGLFANEAAAELLGPSRDDLLLGCGWETVTAGQTREWEGSFDGPVGTERWLRVRQSRMSTQAGPVLLTVVSDVTERKQVEKTLSLSQASVEPMGSTSSPRGGRGTLQAGG